MLIQSVSRNKFGEKKNYTILRNHYQVKKLGKPFSVAACNFDTYKITLVSNLKSYCIK